MYFKNEHESVHQSEVDEGFIPNRLLIQQKLEISLKREDTKIQTKKQFVSRYITEGIMRKQPQQCYSRFNTFDFIQQESKFYTEPEQNDEEKNTIERQTYGDKLFQQVSHKQKGSQKNKILTPYDKFIASGNYILVYSRYKDFKFSNEDPNFAANDVKLDCLKTGQDSKFKAIKAFEMVEKKKQGISMTNLHRSGSMRQPILQFDSKFQCGNLLCAFKDKSQPCTYTLFIQNDTNTYGYNHWFYFSVKNAQIGITYKFNLVNFRKRHSFFKNGNKPCIFSLVDSKKPGKNGYSKRGENVKYGKSPIIKSYDSKEKFFQMSFELKFWNENDLYYISTGLPYSYSKLLNNLNHYEEIARKNKLNWSLQSIGTSISGNSIPYVTITKFQDLQNYTKTPRSNREPYQTISNQVKEKKSRKSIKHVHSEQRIPVKKVIFLTARQHPGETWSSYLMDEFIHTLVTQATPESRYLLENFIIKCVPMINVDGVICGNFRCDLTGMDLNRCWKTPSNLLHPQIFSIKNQILRLTEKGYKIETYFDLHGHSKEYNLFCYSCKTDNYECRLLPYLLSQYNQQFYFPFCTFGISRFKQTTARAVIFGITKNTNVLTIESSLFGSKIEGKIKHFQPESMKIMAQTIIKGCKSYFSNDENYFKCQQVIKERIDEFMSYKGENGNDALSGSDSEPSGDQIDINEKFEKILPKNLINQYPEIQELQRSIKKAKRKIKREKTNPIEQKKSIKKEEPLVINQIKGFNSVKNRLHSKTVKSNWQSFIAKKSQPSESFNSPSFQTRSFILNNKTIGEDEFLTNPKDLYQQLLSRHEHKLPAFPRQNYGLVPMKFRNESIQIFKDAYQATQKPKKSRPDQNNAEDSKDAKRHTRIISFYKESQKKRKEEFPLLCVMSQNRKKRQIQIMQSRRQEIISKSLGMSNHVQKHKTSLESRSQAIKQLRDKTTKNAQLVSKIWKDNLNRFGMGLRAFRIQD